MIVLSTTELSAIRDDLVMLHKAASATEGWDGKQARTFIEVGEYGLALDEIAYASLENDTPMPSEQFAVFESLAAMLQLEGDPEYDGFARLRARAKQKPA